MKRFISFVFALTLVSYLSGATYAQGRGQSVSRGAGQAGRSPQVNRDKDHGRDADQAAGRARQETAKDAAGNSNFAGGIENNPELRTKVTEMLPAGMSLRTASACFKNQGQFIAALNVSRNLNIPFSDLQAKMTGSNARSLGQAIHELKPKLSESEVRREAQKAEKQAKDAEKLKPVG